VLCVGSTQVAAKTLAANFTKQNGHTITVTATAPFNIDKELTAKPFDLLIISTPAMEAYDEAGSLQPGTRTALARVGVGLVVKQGATVPDISTPEAFKRTVLAAKSITHSDPAVPNLAGAVVAAAFAKAGILDEVKAKGLTVAGPVPASLRSYIFYEAGVLAKGAAHELASAFVKFMASAGAGKAGRQRH
jgi:molybdate transport system substrate-binding protein